MRSRHRRFLWGLGLSMVGWVAAGAVEAAAIQSSRLRGSGAWHASGVAQRPGQRWQLDVERSPDDRIRGSVSLGDSPLGRTGVVSGKIDRRRVSGSIHDDNGQLMADFDGTIRADGISGRYTDRSGEVGEWYWQGSLPK